MASSPLALPGAVLPAVTVGASGEAAPNADFSALLADVASATALPAGPMAMPSPVEPSQPLPLDFTPAREPKSGRTGMPGGNAGKNLPDGKLPLEPDAAPLDSVQERRAETRDSATPATLTSHASAEGVMASAPAPLQAPAPSPEVASPPATTSLLMSREQRTNPEMPTPGTSASRPIVRAPRDHAPARSQSETPSRPDAPSPQAVASKPAISSAPLPTQTTAASRAVPVPPSTMAAHPSAMAARQPAHGAEPVAVTSDSVVTPAQPTTAQQQPTHNRPPVAMAPVSAPVAVATPVQQSTAPARQLARGTPVGVASAAVARPSPQVTALVRQPLVDSEAVSVAPEFTTTPARHEASPLPHPQAGDPSPANRAVPLAGHEAKSVAAAPIGTPMPDRRAALLASTAPLVAATALTDVASAVAAPAAEPMVLPEQGTPAAPSTAAASATGKDAPAPEPVAPAIDAEPASQVIPAASKPTPARPELQARLDIAALTQPLTAVAPARTDAGPDAATPTIAAAPQAQPQATSTPPERNGNPAAPAAPALERGEHKPATATLVATSEPAPIRADVPLAATMFEPRAATPVAVATSDATPQPAQDLAALVDRITEARAAAAAPQMVRAALMHEDFGAVSLGFRSDDGHLNVTLTNDDPGFAPAVHAAAAASLAGQARDDQTRRDGQPQQPSASAQDNATANNTATQQQTAQHSGRDRSGSPERAAPRDTAPRQPAGERPPSTSPSQQRRGGIYA